MKKRDIGFMGIGFILAVVLIINIPMVESAIPPTRAFSIIEIMTSEWSPAGDTNVTADSYSQRVYYVSDGSILFNATDTPPP